MPAADSNPFATRYTRPGAIEYLFPSGSSAETLVARLREQHWWGQILGPHGSGKSTLLAALTPELEREQRRVVRFSLGEKQRSLPARSALDAPWDAQTQVVVDGYEQLSWWSRLRLKAQVRRARAGLLVTAHAPVGLPMLLTTSPSLELAQQVVQRLLPVGNAAISPADVAAAFAQQRGNVRETLFQLFDVYQQRRQTPGS